MRAQAEEDNVPSAASRFNRCSDLVAHRIDDHIGAQVGQILHRCGKVDLCRVERFLYADLLPGKFKAIRDQVRYDYLAGPQRLIHLGEEQTHWPRADDGHVIAGLNRNARQRPDDVGGTPPDNGSKRAASSRATS